MHLNQPFQLFCVLSNLFSGVVHFIIACNDKILSPSIFDGSLLVLYDLIMIRKYLRKPSSFEAVQYDGSNFDELEDFAGSDLYVNDGHVMLHTLEGEMQMNNIIGDYLVKDCYGNFFFCKKDAFENLYCEVK